MTRRYTSDPVERVMLRHAYIVTPSADSEPKIVHVFVVYLRLFEPPLVASTRELDAFYTKERRS